MVSCHNLFGFIWFGFEQKVEMQVDINCGKCKNQIMQAVTELEGVNQVVLDEEKSLLTVVGTMDPICIAEQLRKIKQKPVVVNIGPPKPPEKKPECCKPCLPYYNNTCDLPYYNYNTRDMVSVSTYENGGGCTIV
ncbi:heavy metal-associated isoprenylated plant protein 2 isoform X1 [Brassica napus]|nr:heavy metal-associated isoprenylated plant protein 2 isoform X1 [Brassica napus]